MIDNCFILVFLRISGHWDRFKYLTSLTLTTGQPEQCGVQFQDTGIRGKKMRMFASIDSIH